MKHLFYLVSCIALVTSCNESITSNDYSEKNEVKKTEQVYTKAATDYMEIPVFKNGTKAPNSKRVTHMVASTSWYNAAYQKSAITRNFSVLFNTEQHVPYWVAYIVHPMYMGDAKRARRAWKFDPKLESKYQPNLSKSWANINYERLGDKFNRGHLMPSAARNASKDINKTTFYFSNMMPQQEKMNSVEWGALEDKVRDWADQKDYDTLYVVTGIILPKEKIRYAEDLNGLRSAVPKYAYKALLRKDKKTGDYHSIGVKMENINNPGSYSENLVSVEELEKETGFTFFPNLAIIQGVKPNKVKSEKTLEHWQ